MIGDLTQSFRVQRRVLFALLMRETLTRYGRHNIGFLWLFVEPMMFTLGVTALWTATKSLHGSNLPITSFAITGYSSVLLWRNMPARCIGAIPPNLALMFHRNVRVIDIYLSRLVLEAAGATTSFVLLTLAFHSLGWTDLPEDILQVIYGWIILAWFGFALALTLGALSEISEIVEKIWHPMAYFLFPLSGAAFMLDALPAAARGYLMYLPMVNAVEFIREGFFGSKFNAHYDMSYTIWFCAGLTVFGLTQVRRVNQIVTPE